jgi:phospholipid transport system substrate-binding protein
MLAAALALLCASFVPALAATTPAEIYIAQNVQHGLSILNDRSAAPDQADMKFRDFLESLTDIKRIALFTLGPAGNTARPADIDAFVDAFHGYATAVYQSQLSKYSGQSLDVIGSTERAPGDFIVRTKVADANGRIAGDASEVDFRVGSENGNFIVLDASVSGVWLAVNERDQFSGFLAQHHYDIAALTAHIKEVTANMRTK